MFLYTRFLRCKYMLFYKKMRDFLYVFYKKMSGLLRVFYKKMSELMCVLYKKMSELWLKFRSCFGFHCFLLFHNQISETLCGKDFQFALAVAADIVGLHAI